MTSPTPVPVAPPVTTHAAPSRFKGLSRALGYLMLVAAGAMNQPVAQGAAATTIAKTTDAPNPVASGQNFQYFLTYSCSSTTGSCDNVVLTDVLSSDLQFVGLIPTADVASFTAPAVGSAGTITVTFKTPMPAGSSGAVTIIAKYKAGVTPDGTVTVNTASVSGGNIATATSSVSTTSDAASNWTVSKTWATTATLGSAGVSYTVSLCSTTATVAQLDLQNAVMVDTLPVGVLPADVLSSNGATVTGTGVTGDPVKLTWNLGTLSSITGVACPASATKTVSIRYPATQYTDGQVVQNSVSVTGTPVGGASTTIGPAVVNTTLSLPVLGRTLTKAASDTTVDIGQVFDWQLNPDNNAAVPLDNFIISDTLPANFTLDSVFTGTGYTGAPAGNFMVVQYETTAAPGTFTTWPGGPFPVNTTINVSSLGLRARLKTPQTPAITRVDAA